MLKDRREAGHKLAKRLKEWADNQETIVLALPRGGVVVGYEIAKELHLLLDIICPRKIGALENPEYAVGAITETGKGLFSEGVDPTEPWLQQAIIIEKKEAQRRLSYYRGDRAPRDIRNKRVILVDDGMATGFTMRAAIQSVREEGAKEIIVALPVAPAENAAKVARSVDQLVCLETPTLFYAISQFYEHFEQTSDEEVIFLLASQHDI